MTASGCVLGVAGPRVDRAHRKHRDDQEPGHWQRHHLSPLQQARARAARRFARGFQMTDVAETTFVTRRPPKRVTKMGRPPVRKDGRPLTPAERMRVATERGSSASSASRIACGALEISNGTRRPNMSRPRALAVLRLTTNSYLVGCWTGHISRLLAVEARAFGL
jgi:hypothetical protein